MVHRASKKLASCPLFFAAKIGEYSGRRPTITIPNLLTFFRLLLVPPFAYLLLEGELALAGMIFAVAALTDFADGWIARRFGQTSQLGRLLDPLADKLLVGTAIAIMWWTGLLPGWFCLVVAARESFVLASSAIARVRGETELLRPGPFGKAGAAMQMLLIALILLPLPYLMKSREVLLTLMVAATAFTLVSVFRYVRRWRAMRAATNNAS